MLFAARRMRSGRGGMQLFKVPSRLSAIQKAIVGFQMVVGTRHEIQRVGSAPLRRMQSIGIVYFCRLSNSLNLAFTAGLLSRTAVSASFTTQRAQGCALTAILLQLFAMSLLRNSETAWYAATLCMKARSISVAGLSMSACCPSVGRFTSTSDPAAAPGSNRADDD